MKQLQLHSPTLSRALSRALSYSSTAITTPQCLWSCPFKNVIVGNFEPSLGVLRQHVRLSDFVAIDLEMTGVANAPWREPFPFDRSDLNHLKVKDSASKFAVVQFGVCPFRWDSPNQSFVAYPNLLFPCEELAGFIPCNDYLSQTDSMSVLAKYKFDFNAWIHQEREREVTRNLNSHDSEDFDISRLNDVRVVVALLMKPLKLDGFISRELKLIQMKEVKEENQRANEMKVQAAIGFRHVIDLLSSEQKLIVCHNCFLVIWELNLNSMNLQILCSMKKLQNYINRLYLNWMQEDIIDLSTSDKVTNSSPSYSRNSWYTNILFENIVVIWGFPSNVEKSDVHECISKGFGPTSVVYVYYLDATTMFVQFSGTELVSEYHSLKENLDRSNGPNFVMHPL
ncbi:hypothetical protein RYX36_016333 [Vicia faba]